MLCHERFQNFVSIGLVFWVYMATSFWGIGYPTKPSTRNGTSSTTETGRRYGNQRLRPHRPLGLPRRLGQSGRRGPAVDPGMVGGKMTFKTGLVHKPWYKDPTSNNQKFNGTYSSVFFVAQGGKKFLPNQTSEFLPLPLVQVKAINDPFMDYLGVVETPGARVYLEVF